MAVWHAMKTTVHIDNDLVEKLKVKAQKSGESFRKLLNQTLRSGIAAPSDRKRTPYRCPEYSLGLPIVSTYSLDKALALASDLEDAETKIELVRRK